MKQQLEQLKTELREFIALSKRAAPRPWKPSPNNLIGGWWVQTPFNEVAETSTADFCNEADATFIAHSRNISPAMAECLLVAVEGLGELALEPSAYELQGEAFDQRDRCASASKDTLQQILTIWEASK
jgi:hypothetical protein